VSRLPTALQPAWPLFKRAHRMLALVLGLLFRRISPVAGRRRLPHTATMTSSETAAREPDAVTLHPAGPPERLVRTIPQGSPPEHWAFEQALAVDVPARYTLEIVEGIAVGEFGANLTSAGVLDYQTSAYFGIRSWREHPVFLSPRLPPVEDFRGTLLNLTSCGTSDNYYHFMFDVLPRYGIFEESLPGCEVDAVLAPHAARYQRELLALVGVAQPLIQPRKSTALRADRLLVPSTPNLELVAPRWVTQWLRKRLPPSQTRSLPRRLYLTRGDRPNTRRYVQENELWPSLERRGFVKLDPGTLSVQEQIDCFSSADVIVAPHGAALTNLVFCRPGVRVLELFASNYVHLGLWAISQSIDGASYHYLVSDGDHAPGRAMTGVLTDVRIPPVRVLEALDKLLA
jgi:capsular polysaccharide biosynthesis protein